MVYDVLSFQGFGLSEDKLKTSVPFKFEGSDYSLKHGSVVIAAITSCTNTSNPSVMLGAGENKMNDKVLLRERKRRTTRGISCL